jgi:flagellar biosynthetic protein FliR
MLAQFMTTQLFAFLLVFCRTGSAFMLLPGFAEFYIPMRVRLLFALGFSLVLTPIIAMPPVPESVPLVLTLILGEIMVGLFLGSVSRLLIAAIHIAGTIIAYESSLASALTNGINQFQGQDTSIGNLFGVSAIVLLFATNMHHVMLYALMDSYSLFLPGDFPPVGDMMQHITQTMNKVFFIAIKIAAPSIVVSTVLYLGAGILSRLMPNMQIFFIMMAPQLLLSFFIIMVTFSSVMLWYMDSFEQAMGSFVAPQ